MRLTLRTLLAYLDNTLEPADAELLREKLEESGFATQLVQRIRASLTNKGLTAPPPDSVHPIGEANVISEYLDSTLTPEQIAEIERACLESEPHLAEAGACHQILTMVLGKPATVTDQLRQRIYLLPDSVKPVSGSYSSVSIPADESLSGTKDEIPLGEPLLEPAGKTVPPVGPGDSGVSDAPTRLRESENLEQDLPRDANAAVAGSRDREHLEVSDVYSGSIRASRITPWLVTLALAGVLLFVLTQIFAPLLQERTAERDEIEERISLTPGAESADDVDTTLEESTATAAESPSRAAESPSQDSSEADDADVAAEEMAEEEVDEATAAAEADSEKQSEQAPPASDDAADAASPAAAPVATEPGAGEVEEMPADAGSVAAADPADEPVDQPADDTPDEPPMAEKGVAAATEPPSSEDLKKPDEPGQPADASPPSEEAVPLANLMTDKTFLVGRVGDGEWSRVSKEVAISNRIMLINAPGFPSSMTTSEGEFVFTLIGATSAHWINSEEDDSRPGVNVDFGRALIVAKQTGITTSVILGGFPVTITMAEPETVVGMEVRYFRAPGMDPSVAENHTRVARVFSVQGDVQLQTEIGKQMLQTGQQWLIRGDEAAPVAAMTSMPSWVDPPDERDTSIEAEARENLLELITNEQPLMLDLREAVTFRRSEVGALAAQTLLFMGNGGVYFGGDGVLSNSNQRMYWPEHYRALRSVVDYSPEAAEALATSITEMDAADGRTLYRLLVGYSEKQLVENGDEELVDLLDSNSMAVRVLAIENLRAITGTTLNYRAEVDNATRRAQATKKWRTRQRKGDIRWNAGQ